MISTRDGTTCTERMRDTKNIVRRRPQPELRKDLDRRSRDDDEEEAER